MLKEDEVLRDVAVRLAEIVGVLDELPDDADLSGKTWVAIEWIREVERRLRGFAS